MLKKLFGAKNSTQVYRLVTPELTQNLQQNIFSQVGSRAIPSMPAAAQKAFQLSTDPNAEAKDFVQVIESDESMSARVLRIANSVYFDRGHKSQTIDDAVNVIGIQELRNLLNANTLSQIFPSSHAAREQLWINDIATGLLARELSERFIPRKSGEAFLGGLMHDVGKLLLLQRLPDKYQTILFQVQQGRSFCEAEEEQFPFDHTEAGQLVAREWNFTEELTQIIRMHHFNWQDMPPVKPEPPLAALVKAADTIAHSLGYGLPANFHRFRNLCRSEVDAVWEYFAIPDGERSELTARLIRTYDAEHSMYLS